jgi:hypothetical protein
VTVLILVILVVPGVLFASYRFQRARELRRRHRKGVAGPDRFTGSAVRRPSRQQRRSDLRRLGYRYADDTIFVHGTAVIRR